MSAPAPAEPSASLVRSACSAKAVSRSPSPPASVLRQFSPSEWSGKVEGAARTSEGSRRHGDPPAQG
ncbi:MAG: hypothetical protein R3F11_27700 [Verrucomicrobiales bacterium]